MSTPAIIPRPVSVQQLEGAFSLESGVAILVDGQDSTSLQIAEYLVSRVTAITGLSPKISSQGNTNEVGSIVLRTARTNDFPPGDEAYRLLISDSTILLEANQPQGWFRGVQTLAQLLVTAAENAGAGEKGLSISAVTISDYPRYRYRGMHLDVCRHYFPLEFIKKYIDLLAAYKYNYFHWHLTEDQGWRIEIKKYPKLTQVGSWRQGENGERYGGFYTQDDIKEVVAYAASRFITVIPEIEMPGHATAALAAYPELSCTDGPFEVGTLWGVFDDVYCAGNDSAFVFLENVLTEVLDLFPGKYVHIGGDECPKTRWEKCAKCQQRIREESLADEHELQSYFIKRIERFLSAHGRVLIGWDEILEGGLADNATVMSWRGMDGGIKAARADHDVIMTPTDYCYFDHYQAEPEFEPKAFGGYTPLKKVYSFEPTPQELDDSAAAHILGAQANLWTEYIETPEHAEYMAVSRMLALSEVIWSPAAQRDWLDFKCRLQLHFDWLRKEGVNYCPGSYRVGITVEPRGNSGSIVVSMDSEQPNLPIRYTLDGTEPSGDAKEYAKPLVLSESAIIKAALIDEAGSPIRKITELTFNKHLAVGQSITYASESAPRYTAGGAMGIVNGVSGSTYYADGRWRAHRGENFAATIDLGQVRTIQSISAGFLHNTGSWIFMPDTVTIEISIDGDEYTKVAQLRHEYDQADGSPRVELFEHTLGGIQARFIRLSAQTTGICPEWHKGAGGRSWLFVDEIIVR